MVRATSSASGCTRQGATPGSPAPGTIAIPGTVAAVRPDVGAAAGGQLVAGVAVDCGHAGAGVNAYTGAWMAARTASGLEQAVFGWTDAQQVDNWVDRHVRERLGRGVDRVLFRSGRVFHLPVVAGCVGV